MNSKSDSEASANTNSSGDFKAFYTTDEIDKDLVLFEGSGEVNFNNRHQRAHLTVSLVWKPSPHIEGHAKVESTTDIMDLFHYATLNVPYQNRFVRFTPYADGVRDSSSSKYDYTVTGSIEATEELPDTEVHSVIFHLANGPTYYNLSDDPYSSDPSHAYPTQPTSTDRTITLNVGPWRIVLEALSPWYQMKNWEKLHNQRGYAITHVGKISLAEGKEFVASSLQPVLEALGWLFSFCLSEMRFPMLLVGINSIGEKVFETWSCYRNGNRKNPCSWYWGRSHHGLKIFERLYSLFISKDLQEVIEQAIRWYISTSYPFDTRPEGAIVIQDVAFESLAYAILVNQNRELTSSQFNKITRANRLRKLLSACGIPMDKKQPDLLVQQLNKYNDGAAALARIRNSIVHASSRGHPQRNTDWANERKNAYLLGQSYLALILLNIFGYEHAFVDHRNGGVNNFVPWASAKQWQSALSPPKPDSQSRRGPNPKPSD